MVGSGFSHHKSECSLHVVGWPATYSPSMLTEFKCSSGYGMEGLFCRARMQSKMVHDFPYTGTPSWVPGEIRAMSGKMYTCGGSMPCFSKPANSSGMSCIVMCRDVPSVICRSLNPEMCRTSKPAVCRAVMTPFMANKTIGTNNFKYVLYGDDDTVFFPENVLDLVNGLDHEMPYFMTDCIWFPEKEGNTTRQLGTAFVRRLCRPCGASDACAMKGLMKSLADALRSHQGQTRPHNGRGEASSFPPFWQGPPRSSLAALSRNTIKRPLAWSSIGHVGHMLVGLCCGSLEGLQGFILCLVVSIVMMQHWLL